MTEREGRERIEKAGREGWMELNLAGKGIKSLPREIGKLTNLRELNLRSNRLRSVPKELGQLTNLNSLDLSANQLRRLPAGSVYGLLGPNGADHILFDKDSGFDRLLQVLLDSA